jgi:golgi SNAP receptor complex member 2
LAYDARQQLSQLQHGILSSPSAVSLGLDELSNQLDLLQEHLLTRETPEQRLVWNRKVLELREDVSNIRMQLERFMHSSKSGSTYSRDRTELLTRRRRRRGGQDQPTEDEKDLNNLAEESQSWQHSSVMVDDLLSSGQASLEQLVRQRSRLRGIRKVITDIADRLGITALTMRIIERRDTTDGYLVLAGMIVTCLVIYLCYFHFEK